MNKKKIVFHINSLGKGGAEHVVSMLSGFFAVDGYEVVIITLWRAEEEYELPEGVSRINLGDRQERKGRWKRAVGRFTDLRKAILEENPDIVISFCNKANFRSAFSMAGMKTPLLISVRNDPEKDYAPYKLPVWWMERKASGCVFQTKEAQKFFRSGLQKKSRVIWNLIDEKYLKTEKKDNKGYFIAAVGRISSQKNHMLLLKAFHRIKDKFQDTELRIYGEDCEKDVREALDRFVTEQGLSDRVRFMGQSSHLEKDLQGAKLFVLPSDYEGMPNALAEAMVLGLPVIATDCPCGGCAMLIEDGVSGILVPVRDEEKMAQAMEKLLADRELAESMGRNAARISDKISPEKVYEEWKTYVESIINN
ncbi:MAG: glycosyltransferase [Suilimivivens sp.]